MFNALRGEHGTFGPERHLPDLIETLPDELLVVDDHATILYAMVYVCHIPGTGALGDWFCAG
jgi:hypothetical protein